MHELRVGVERVEGRCSGPVPMGPGRYFVVRDGRLHFPEGGPICLFALQSILPLIPAKERLDDGTSSDWMGKVHHVQCPDPDGRTVWRIEQRAPADAVRHQGTLPDPEAGDLQVVVDRIEGRCNAGTCVGDRVLVRGSSLYLAQPFCLYALASILTLLPAKDRCHDPDDWMVGPLEAVCPDPLGNVILKIEAIP